MHLSISAAEWRTFLQIADDTFERKHVPMHARRDLREILAGFQQQCVLPAGRLAPPDPGAPRPHPSTLGTTFHRLGGVYPIAQFADRLVDALAAPAGPGADIGVKLEPVDDPASTRHPPGLKYLLTEMLCSAAGGKEVVTARGFEEAKLGVPAANWPAFCALVTQHAATVFPTAHHRAAVLQLVSDLRPELCSGALLKRDDSDADVRSRKLKAFEAAGFERLDALAALAQRDDDEEKGMELLLTGWRPDQDAADAARAAAAEEPKCPFGFGAGGGGGGDDEKWRVVGAPALAPALAETVKTMSERAGQSAEAIAELLKLDLEAVKATLNPPEAAPDAGPEPLPPGLAEAARTMAARGVTAEQIADMLKVEAASVEVTLHPPAVAGAAMYKVVGDPMQLRLDELLEEEVDLCCPVTLVLFADPVTAKDGFVYERSAVEAMTANPNPNPS